MDDGWYAQLLRCEPGVMNGLIAQYIKPVHHLATMIIGQVGTPQDVEEVTADAFARAWARISEFNPEQTTLLSWLLMLTKYAALDRRRQLLRHRFQPDGSARVVSLEVAPEPATDWTPEAAALRSDRSSQVHAALERLPDEQRELLIRRYIYEEPIADLAQALGLSRGALDNRLWRARLALKAVLTENEGVQDCGQSAV